MEVTRRIVAERGEGRTFWRSEGRYLRMVCKWAGGGYLPPDFDVYIRCMGEPSHAVAGSRWYRTAQNRELLRMLRGDYAHTQVDVPVQWLVGLDDPVVMPMGGAPRAV